MKRLKRNINLKIFWARQKKTNYTASLLSNVIRSKWTPPEALKESSDLWDGYAKAMAPPTNTAQNIPRSAIESWNRFIKSDKWYVVKADKGGKLVTWARDSYKKEAIRQLSDTNTYAELSLSDANALYRDLHGKKARLVRALTARGNITRSESTRILNEPVKMPSIYFLPKIHKEKRKDTGTFNGRPIIAAVGSMLKSLDQYLANITAPILKEIPGSLIDTGALLRDIEKLKNLNAEAQLHSADVEALYPSIPWAEGLDSATELYRSKYRSLTEHAQRINKLPPPRPDIFKEILKLILENNVFHFQESRWFKQLKGTAMGCSMSVFLANAFMFKRTRHLIRNPPRDLLYFGRFIDDIIAVFIGNKEAFVDLFTDVVDENIKLTYVHGDKELEALDVKLRIENDGTISSRLYRKPTDGHQYLHWSSAHPESLKRSIPYAQLLRIRRNCTFDVDFEREAGDLLQRFRKRKYPEMVLQKALEKARLRDRQSLLDTGNPKPPSGERMTLVIDYSAPERGKLQVRTTEFWQSLRETTLRYTKASAFLPEDPPRTAFRLGRTLGSKLGPAFKKGQGIDNLTQPNLT